MGICDDVCMNTSTKFYTTDFIGLGVCVGVGQCERTIMLSSAYINMNVTWGSNLKW